MSVGAHKSVMISTAPYQSGAVKFAQAHGIALVTVTEGRFTVEYKSADPVPPPSRESAARFGVPTFVGHHYRQTDEGSMEVTVMSSEYPEYVAELLLGVPRPTSK
ncbi:hypothetical protein ACI2LF_11055 [Kribbella sp. NPDC020789]